MAKKTGLGKGLSSLLSEAVHESGSDKQMLHLPIKDIVPNADQPRSMFDQEDLEELADSIKQVGVLQPILVRQQGSKYQIIAGERRYQAAKLAGLKVLPVQIKQFDDIETLKVALIENIQRANLNPIEEAKAYKELIHQANLTQEDLAQAVSKSRSTITNALRLLDLPKEVISYLEAGVLTAGHARTILRLEDKESQLRFAKEIIENKMSVRATEKLVPQFFGNSSVKRREATPRTFKAAAKQLRETLERNVRVKQVRGKNKIEIEFEDEQDLVQLVHKLIGELNQKV